MQPLVQSAIDAANRGENKKALELCRQALSANPNDVDAWLVTAAVVDQPERKRQCLNRVLALDPTNEIARDELLEMDRAAMGGAPAFSPEPGPVSQPTYPTSTSAFESDPDSAYSSSYFSEDPDRTAAFESVPASTPSSSAPVQPQAKAAVKPSPQTRLEKSLVFKYPLFWRILMYVAIAFFACLGLLVASMNVVNSLPFLGLALLTGIVAMAFLPKVEVTEAGIRAFGMFNTSEVKWGDIKSIKSGGLQQRLELLKSNGEVVKVSSQVSGYPRIVEILRHKRPDLFGMAATASASGYEPVPSGGRGSAAASPTFSGAKKFEKGFLRQYRSYIIVLPLAMISAWAIFAEPQNRVGASIVLAVCILAMFFPLFEVSGVNVEPNKLTVEMPFEQKVLGARQIREIKMQTVRNRYGSARNFVVIVTAQGKKYSLDGFAEGPEIIYGFLTNWWNTYRSKSSGSIHE